MNWFTVIWSMAAAFFLIMAALLLLFWAFYREKRAHLIFSLSSLSAALLALLELNLMQAESPLEYAEILRWMHATVAVLIISIVWFIHYFLNMGRRWLAWIITGLRLIILVPNFWGYANATFTDITGLQKFVFWGEIFSVPVGTENPWRVLIHLSVLFFMIYVCDASLSAWRKGQYRRALIFGGAIFSAIILSAMFSHLMTIGVIPGPFITLTFMVIISPMAFEMVVDMRHSQQMAKELEKNRHTLAHVSRVSALGQLSSSLAHEINQPLGAILRNTEAADLLLQNSPADLEELRQIVDDIGKDSQRAVVVMERMRSLLKRGEPAYEKIIVGELIKKVAAILRTEIQAHNANLKIEFLDTAPEVYGDFIQLQQVLINLLLNSLESLDELPEARRKIVMLVKNTQDSNLEIAITDYGTGISVEQLPHMFEPFNTSKPEGIGIGLTISKTIVEMHGGKISAENNPDVGATIKILLPIKQQDQDAIQ